MKVQDGVWQLTLPNSFFGRFNPYNDLIHGDWFNPKGRPHHSGAVYLNGEWLVEAPELDSVLKAAGTTPLWFAKVDGQNTTIWAQFKGLDPNEQLVEINVRQTIFYPDSRAELHHCARVHDAARGHAWAPPTAEQIGLIGTHWSKGWVIESNVSATRCVRALRWENTATKSTTRRRILPRATFSTVERALKNGWNKETIGHHLVRDNSISHCEQAGVVGSLGAAFSTVTGNTIHDIHVRRLFSGAEMAGIKFHGAIDTTIRNNHIYRTVRGLWLDWMAQGTRVSGNFFHDNASEDLFVEVNHGPSWWTTTSSCRRRPC